MFTGLRLISLVLAVIPVVSCQGPVVRLDNADFVGSTNGSLTKFLGIPFAKPPTRNRRFGLPEPNDPYNGTYNVTLYGPSCPQHANTFVPPEQLDPQALQFLLSLVPTSQIPESEDCLTVNIIKPANADPKAKLPVVVWIYGGGFLVGSTASFTGDSIVAHSIELGQPIIYVSMNYRVSAFGFLGGNEAKDAGVANAGLHDQRQALRWVQQYIHAFGGDPEKVTIWGVSAGAISAALQMVANGGNTEGLFHGAFMHSGAVIPRGDISLDQQSYDNLVRATGCAGAEDTLECLRQVPFPLLKQAADQSPELFSYQSLNLSWGPRADGTFLDAPLQHLVLQGSVAKIPFVTGTCDDEGTLFSLTNLNVTTDAQFEEYIHSNYFPTVDSIEFQKIVDEYPSDVTMGSPYDTGTLNALTPQYKRIASIQGDLAFQGPRRLLLEHVSHKQNAWSFVSNRTKSLPDFGSAHGTDMSDIQEGGPLATAVINFVNHLDPNGESGNQWPKYSSHDPKNLVFGPGTTSVQDDTYRKKAMSVLNAVLLQHPI